MARGPELKLDGLFKNVELAKFFTLFSWLTLEKWSLPVNHV